MDDAKARELGMDSMDQSSSSKMNFQTHDWAAETRGRGDDALHGQAAIFPTGLQTCNNCEQLPELQEVC